MKRAALLGWPRRWRGATRRDFGPLLGLLACLGFLGAGMSMAGSWGLFLDPSSALIVLGGTVAAAFVSFQTSELRLALAVIAGSLTASRLPAPELHARRLLDLARFVRTAGLLALEARLAEYRDRPVLSRGLELLLEGREPEEIEAILERQRQRAEEPFATAEALLRRAAEVAPAMGLMGTLIGLVRMLAELNRPENIGPGMAIALLTTLYGALLAHAVFAPLAERLHRRGQDEHRYGQLELLAISSIGRGENPRYLITSLNSCLPPDHQLVEI